jgi:hypothetical protein
MYHILNLSSGEIAALRSWYEFVNEDSLHYGGGRLLLPSEQMLLRKIKGHIAGPMSLTTSELEIINDWMSRAVERKYGDERYLFGYELLVYEKLKASVEAH